MKTKYSLKKQDKSKKIKQKGGNTYIDTDFLRCYDDNLRKVMSAIEEYSGKHSIDTVLANEFIENQTSPIRREAAKNLIDNTIYITLQEVYDIIGNLIDIVYPNFNSNDTIYLYSGMPEKSGYFFSVIALNHIRKKGYKEPIFLKKLTDECFDNISDSPIIILDDVSYSGSQLSEQLKSIYYSRMYIKESPNYPPNIYILLVALNDISKKMLSEVPSSKNITSSKIYIDPYKESPFKLIYLEDRLYKSLISILGIEKFIYLKMLFAPWLCLDDNALCLPPVSLYLDSKIADPVSTFTTTLIYGQIPPSNVDFSFFIKVIHDGGLKGKLYDIPQELKTRLLNELSAEFKSENSNSSDFLIEKIIKNFIKLDVQDKPSNEILFKPFINTCNSNPSLIEIIEDESIKKLNYLIFMLPQDCFTKKNCSIDFAAIEDYIIYLKENGYFVSKDYEVKDNTGKISKKPRITTHDGNLPTMEIHKKITSVKCPISWYKKGPFKMECTSLVGGKKNKTKRRSNRKKTRKNK
jgi:hypothetical protein